MPNQKHHVFFLCRYSAVAYSRSGRLCRKNANEVFKNAMAALALAPSWTTWSVVELLSRKELALLCQLASSAEAILRQRLFSIDSQKFGTVGRSHDHFQRGWLTKCSQFWTITDERQKHSFSPCARWHTQLFTEYRREDLFPVSPRWLSESRRWDLKEVINVHPFRKRRYHQQATPGRASSSAERIFCTERIFMNSRERRQERSCICISECCDNMRSIEIQ